MHVKVQTCLPENLSHDFLPLRGAGRSGHSVVKQLINRIIDSAIIIIIFNLIFIKPMVKNHISVTSLYKRRERVTVCLSEGVQYISGRKKLGH